LYTEKDSRVSNEKMKERKNEGENGKGNDGLILFVRFKI